MDLGGRADRFKFLIRVRGDRFTKTFDELFAVNGVRERYGASALTIC